MSELSFLKYAVLESTNKISFRMYGNGVNKVIFFHGFPGSSSQIEVFKDYINQFDLQIVCIDRPGYNESSFNLDESQFDQVNQAIVSFIKFHNWQKVNIIAVSGGVPFAIHFVNNNIEFVENTTLVCGLMPFTSKNFRQYFSLKAISSLKTISILPNIFLVLLKKYLDQNQEFKKSKKKSSSVLRYFMPSSSADDLVLQKTEVIQVFETALHEALKQNCKGPQRDARAYLSKWSPLIRQNYSNRLCVWHGQEDKIIPHEVSLAFSELNKNAELHVVKNEGHYSLLINNIEKILFHHFSLSQ